MRLDKDLVVRKKQEGGEKEKVKRKLIKQLFQ